MLPGIRFLFATMLLGVSLAICGIGATALLRAAQEHSASLPSLQALRDPFPPPPAELPTIALMRIEIPATNEDTASPASSPVPASQADIASTAPVTTAEPARQEIAPNNPLPDVQNSTALPDSDAPAAPKPDDRIAAVEQQKPANETLGVKAGDISTAPAAPAVTEPGIVVSESDTESKIGEPQTPQQSPFAAEMEKTASAASVDNDATLATGSLLTPGEAVPSPRPKPVIATAPVTKRVARRAPVRRVARTAPRPQAPAKQTSPFGF